MEDTDDGASPSAAPRRSARTTTSRLAASSEAVGSSISMIGEGSTKERAMLTRCCSPPEKVAGARFQSRSGRLSRASIACARSVASSGATPRASSGSRTMSSAETRGMTRRNCETKPSVRRRMSSTVRGTAATMSIGPAVMGDRGCVPAVGR